MNYQFTGTVRKFRFTVCQAPNVVWEIIANPLKWHALHIPGVFSTFHSPLDIGAEVTVQSAFGGETWRWSVLACEPEKRLYIGRDGEVRFGFDIDAAADGAEVIFLRAFRDLNALQRLFFRSKEYAEFDRLGEVTVDRLQHACELRSQGSDDGLTESMRFG